MIAFDRGKIKWRISKQSGLRFFMQCRICMCASTFCTWFDGLLWIKRRRFYGIHFQCHFYCIQWSSLLSIYSVLNYFYRHCSIARCIFILCFKTWRCRQNFLHRWWTRSSVNAYCIMMWHRHTTKHINKRINKKQTNERTIEWTTTTQICAQAHLSTKKLNRMHVKNTWTHKHRELVREK